MSNNNYVALTQILQSYAIMVPLILIHAAGVVVAIKRWNRHPKISRFALAGFGIPLFLNLVMPVISGLITASMIGSGYSSPYTHYYGILISVVHSTSAVFAAVGYFLLILAVFSERQQRSSDRSGLAGEEMNTNAR
jgi:hypothetical protein